MWLFVRIHCDWNDEWKDEQAGSQGDEQQFSGFWTFMMNQILFGFTADKTDYEGRALHEAVCITRCD